MIVSSGHQYDCLTIDAIKAGVKLDEVIGNVVDAVPPPANDSGWTRGCPLPRVICINILLPYFNPKNPWAKDDGGCSFVGFFEITAETIKSLEGGNAPPCVHAFQKFCEGPAGKPGGPLDDPNRCLARRRNPQKTQDRDSGLFKVIGWCENTVELCLPEYLRQFNGKSFAITDSGYVIKDPEGEWLELGFDVRKLRTLPCSGRADVHRGSTCCSGIRSTTCVGGAPRRSFTLASRFKPLRKTNFRKGSCVTCSSLE